MRPLLRGKHEPLAATWGKLGSRRATSHLYDDHWEKPLRWEVASAKARQRFKMFPSVCDPFDNAAAEKQRGRFAGLIRQTPNLVWLLLTKRIGNAAPMLDENVSRERAGKRLAGCNSCQSRRDVARRAESACCPGRPALLERRTHAWRSGNDSSQSVARPGYLRRGDWAWRASDASAMARSAA